mmetsp:Transcript_6858/g.20287  ORF Transcript_6858/g.20287 Transcript_6858/m.20287 type:complete len:280 (+) Transcript_6858:637-1476(+)
MPREGPGVREGAVALAELGAADLVPEGPANVELILRVHFAVRVRVDGVGPLVDEYLLQGEEPEVVEHQGLVRGHEPQHHDPRGEELAVALAMHAADDTRDHVLEAKPRAVVRGEALHHRPGLAVGPHHALPGPAAERCQRFVCLARIVAKQQADGQAREHRHEAQGPRPEEARGHGRQSHDEEQRGREVEPAVTRHRLQRLTEAHAPSGNHPHGHHGEDELEEEHRQAEEEDEGKDEGRVQVPEAVGWRRNGRGMGVIVGAVDRQHGRAHHPGWHSVWP